MSPSIRRACFFIVIFSGGAVLMALEIVASRVLAPSFGNSVYVWGSIISVFLAALSLGYLLGGRIADRTPTLAGLAQMIALAGAAEVVLLLVGRRVTVFLGDLTGGTPVGTLLAATVLFAPPSVLLATISPYAIRIAGRDLDRLGGTAGGLYAVSTAGSLAGTLGCTFLLIPFLDLAQVLAILVASTGIVSLLATAAAERRRTGAAALGALLVAIAFVARPSVSESGGLVYERMTPYQTLRVRDAGDVRYLESDRTLHAAVRRSDGAVALAYPKAAAAALLLDPDVRRILVLGMGGGSVVSHLRGQIPSLEADLVDVDRNVPEVAKRYMGFHAAPADRIYVDDARRFVARTQERWDLIYCDTYIGLSVPFHLTTVEFLDLVRGRLAPGGVFALNLASPLDHPFPRAILRTVIHVFPSVYVFGIHGTSNTLILAASEERVVSQPELLERARELDARYDFEPTLTELARGRNTDDVDLLDVPLLSDRFAPVDYLVHLRTPSIESR